MSVATPTVIPRSDVFPILLPRPPHPHPTPLPQRINVYERMNARRDLVKEMDDLSEEEDELDDLKAAIEKRGSTFLIPIGKSLTHQEELNEDDQTEDSQSAHSGAQASAVDDVDGENDSVLDLDASLEDMDAEEEGETGDELDGDDDFEEEISVDI